MAVAARPSASPSASAAMTVGERREARDLGTPRMAGVHDGGEHRTGATAQLPAPLGAKMVGEVLLMRS